MRYYNLVITDSAGLVYQPSPTGGFTKKTGGSTFSSLFNGRNDPGALNVEFDIPVAPYHTPQGNPIIKIWGVGLGMISQVSNLNPDPASGTLGANFVLSAGMSKGLPLANPKQAGVIAQGHIFQAFGNWQGVNQTLELICQAGGLEPTNGVSFAWWPGMTLAETLGISFSQGFSSYKQSISVSPNLIQSEQEVPECGFYEDLATFSQFIFERTLPLGKSVTGNDHYPGVSIAIDPSTKTIYATDGTQPTVPTLLAFQDLVGQPTWIGPNTVNFKAVMRADIMVGDQIKFPVGVQSPYALTLAAAAAPGAMASSKTAFQGNFLITRVQHFANFRQPDADSWVTAFDAVTT